MKIVILFTLIFVSLPTINKAQTVSIKGIIRDTISQVNLHNAVVYLKHPQSATLITYVRSDTSGAFEISNLAADTFVMVVTYPGFVDWIDSVTGNTFINVNLVTQAKLLEEVMVTAVKTPMRLKGDTTEFFADYFKLRPDATVEDLLKILPGMSVNAKGEIKVHGQMVQKVLVDGEEFFGNDPTLATQNLNKNAISRVQVYDKKTDKAIITGIDDGIRDKTINLVLKEDAKKGYFGELYGGTDFNKYYQTKATISRFTSKLKAGALFLSDRTGRTPADYQQEGDFGLASAISQGIPESIQASAMLNKKFGPLQNNTANNANYNQVNVSGESYTGIKYILPDTVYYNRQYNTNKNNSWQQAFNSRNEFRLDSFTTLTVNARFRFGKTQNISTQNGQYLASDNSTRINASEQNNVLSGENNGGNADIYLKRVLDKKGLRFLTVNAGFSKNDNKSEGYLYNKTTYFQSGAPSQIVDQKKINIYRSHSVQALASYVMPVLRNVSMNLNYTMNIDNTSQDVQSYEYGSGKYDSLNALYSNNYRFINASHRAGTALSVAAAKITANAGFAVQGIRMKQHDLYTGATSTRNFTNIFPTAEILWKYAAGTNVSLNYSGRTQQPTFAQLQPILNNNDPLNIQIGNPGLKPAFYHSLAFRFTNIRRVVGNYMRAGASLMLARNDFNTASQIDNLGKRVFQTINVNGNYNYNLWITYARVFRHFNMSLNPEILGAQYNNYINGIRNTTSTFSFSPTLYINSWIDKILDIQSQYNIEFRRTVSSVNPQAPTNYKLFSIWLSLDYTPKTGWLISSSYDYKFRQKLSAGDRNNNAMIWNISVEKKIIPKANISAILRINDVFNQRIGFERAINSTSITENTFTTIQRYIMFSLRWRFNKTINP